MWLPDVNGCSELRTLLETAPEVIMHFGVLTFAPGYSSSLFAATIFRNVRGIKIGHFITLNVQNKQPNFIVNLFFYHWLNMTDASLFMQNIPRGTAEQGILNLALQDTSLQDYSALTQPTNPLCCNEVDVGTERLQQRVSFVSCIHFIHNIFNLSPNLSLNLTLQP